MEDFVFHKLLMGTDKLNLMKIVLGGTIWKPQQIKMDC